MRRIITGKSTDSSQLDVVNLGTSIIDARGALRLAKARHDRLNKLGAAKAVSQEEVEDAAINRETAQHKVELLTTIARSAIDVAKADVAAAESDARRPFQSYENVSVNIWERERAEAQIETARAKLKLLESILGASTPNSPPPKAGNERPNEPKDRPR